jgi:protein-L-isoaspartate(D-aspartate) O-methyltransferase
MVARMTEALDLGGWPQRHAGDFRRPRVLDVGTGSGYQAAVLAELAADVVGVERDRDLATEARERLREAGYAVRVEVGDGSEGFPGLAPYAGIVVAAAAPSVPAPLVDQLDVGGRVVIPVGTRERQVLTVVERGGEEDRRWELDPCVFVPLVGRYGFDA